MDVYAQSDVATAKWMKQPVTIDGINKEWGSLNFYDDQTQLNFGMANDSNNIYLCFATINEPVEMKVMRAGMKVTLSTKGKPKQEASIIFPLAQTRQPHYDSAGNESNGSNMHPAFNRETFRENYIAEHSMMQTSGFAIVNGQVSTKNPAIQAAINWDSAGNIIYELAIAKKEFFGSGYTPKQAMEDITLSVEVNALPRSASGDESRNGGNSYQGGGMHGGGGMHKEGFNGGERSEGGETNTMNNNDRISLSTKTSFKQRFVLNNGNN